MLIVKKPLCRAGLDHDLGILACAFLYIYKYNTHDNRWAGTIVFSMVLPRHTSGPGNFQGSSPMLTHDNHVTVFHITAPLDLRSRLLLELLIFLCSSISKKLASLQTRYRDHQECEIGAINWVIGGHMDSSYCSLLGITAAGTLVNK